jgi:hypothetical protein
MKSKSVTLIVFWPPFYPFQPSTITIMSNILSQPVTPTASKPSNPYILQFSIAIKSCRPCSVSPLPPLSTSTYRSLPLESTQTTLSWQACCTASHDSHVYKAPQAPNTLSESDSNWTILPLGPFGEANEGKLALQAYAYILGCVVTIESTTKTVRRTVI